MRVPLGRRIGVAVALLVAVTSFRTAHAECIRVEDGPTACEELAKAGIVFEAEVLDVDLRPGVGFVLVEFQILRSFKGDKSGRWSGAFSYDSIDHMFAPGTHVLVYATERKGIWRTGCNRTKAYDEREADALAEEVAQLTACSSRTK